MSMSESKAVVKNFKGIIDTTLREGFQFRNANFSLIQKQRIFAYLNRINVDYLEVGNPVSKEIRKMTQALIRKNPERSVKILAHIRNREKDLMSALECGVDGVNILCTADNERLESMNCTFDGYVQKLAQNIHLAKKNGMEVRVSVEDYFNQPYENCLEIYRAADALDVDRLGAADTLGKAMQWDIIQRVGLLRHEVRADIEVHLHNDLGHAVTNALTALWSGANWVNTSLLGIGERTGITPLSSMLVNLYLLDPAVVARYDLSCLTRAEHYVSRICGVEVPHNLVTNPSSAFAHKAGIHLNALVRFGPHKYEPFPPALVGNKRTLVRESLISGRTVKKEVDQFNKKYS